MWGNSSPLLLPLPLGRMCWEQRIKGYREDIKDAPEEEEVKRVQWVNGRTRKRRARDEQGTGRGCVDRANREAVEKVKELAREWGWALTFYFLKKTHSVSMRWIDRCLHELTLQYHHQWTHTASQNVATIHLKSPLLRLAGPLWQCLLSGDHRVVYYLITRTLIHDGTHQAAVLISKTSWNLIDSFGGSWVLYCYGLIANYSKNLYVQVLEILCHATDWTESLTEMNWIGSQIDSDAFLKHILYTLYVHAI